MEVKAVRIIDRYVILTVLVIVLLSFTAQALAVGPLYDVSTSAKVSRKFLRGLLNIPFCWVEIPKEINIETQNLDPFTGFWSGLVKGTAKAVKRFGIGVWDLVTFPFPTPKKYATWQSPEFPLMDQLE
jgi:putative exosortase-associated protein (TIGR04073 family)